MRELIYKISMTNIIFFIAKKKKCFLTNCHWCIFINMSNNEERRLLFQYFLVQKQDFNTK